MEPREILSKIYVDAHLKDFTNGVEYTGSLSPQKSKSVNQALSELAKWVRGKKIDMDELAKEDWREHNEALESIAKELEG